MVPCKMQHKMVLSLKSVGNPHACLLSVDSNQPSKEKKRKEDCKRNIFTRKLFKAKVYHYTIKINQIQE